MNKGFLKVEESPSRRDGLVYAARLHEKGVRFDLHILGRGEHGASVWDEWSSMWTAVDLDWLQARGIAPAQKPVTDSVGKTLS